MRKLDTTRAMTFLEWLNPSGPWVLVACRGHTPIQTRLCSAADAPKFLSAHTQRGHIVRVLLGEPEPNFRQSKRLPTVTRTRYAGLAVSIARFKELDDSARPSIWITAKDHAIAVWRFGLPAPADEAQAAITAFAMEFGGKVLHDVIPVPGLGNGFELNAFRFDRDAIVWRKQIQVAPGPKKAETGAQGQSRRLVDAFADYDVRVRVTGVMSGPVITLFQIEPEKRVKVSSINNAIKDVARVMKCGTARVVDMPGTGALGVEIPNKDRETVHLQELLDSGAFKKSDAALPLALGKTIDGKPVVADLATMPHLLMGGTTGSGKSVLIKAMIQSLVHALPPSKLGFIMVDPKMLDLAAFGALPHMAAPVIIDTGKVAGVLEWAVREMMRRYKTMNAAGVVDLAEYNGEARDSMARIVIIIDELAELMSKQTEGPISRAMQRLAQMGRACGIHLIAATQRPSADVLPGVVKTNFPSRIALKVSPGPDSSIILGEPGAADLLGKGDMLWLSGGGDITRVHGAFVDPKDVKAEVRRQKDKYGEPQYREDLLKLLEDDGEEFEPGTARVAAAPKPKLSSTIMKYASALQEIFVPGGAPIAGKEVRRAIVARGLSWGQSVYDAADALLINRGDRASMTDTKDWTPPSEWPPEFDLALG